MDYLKQFSLEGKIALVTGASYGIGFAIASAYAKCGATIVFNDIKQELAKAIPANVVAAGNPCRVIRPITEEDAKYWSHQLELTRKLLEESE